MEEYNDGPPKELIALWVLDATAVLGGIAVGRKLREQGSSLPLAIAAGIGTTLIGVGVVEQASKALDITY
jgi:hypothetical protein